MATSRRPSFSKRQKEQKRREKQKRKNERRAQRETERKEIPKEDRGPDDDIAHIIPGPQPLPWEMED